jgi:hypothetical protein
MTLDRIGLKHGTDKASNHHNYMPVYERYFEHLRHEPIVLLELGFGGYQYPDRGGAGAKTWAEYFWNGTIITTDIHKKIIPSVHNIHFYQVGQNDEACLKEFLSGFEPPTIIIDDASHQCDMTVLSFEILFPVLKPGGIYVIEDCHTSYWPDHGYGGGWHENTTMNHFKRLADHLNAEHNGLEPRPDIEAIHFWKQQIFILKAK